MTSEENAEEYVKHHKDGSVWAKGTVLGNTPVGYWEWFRKDGTLMRSGHFNNGIQVGEWTTYDKQGKPYKVTDKKEGSGDGTKTEIEK